MIDHRMQTAQRECSEKFRFAEVRAHRPNPVIPEVDQPLAPEPIAPTLPPDPTHPPAPPIDEPPDTQQPQRL